MKHETRITAFMFFTKHETRLFSNHGLFPNHALDALFTIVHDCSPLFAIVQQKNIVPASVRAPSGVLVGPHDWPACLITQRSKMRERAVRTRGEPGGGKRREQSYLQNRLLHPSGHETRPLRFFTNHESRITAFMFFTNHESGTQHQTPARSPLACRPVTACLRAVMRLLRRYGAVWAAIARHGRAMAWHGRHIAPAQVSALPRAFSWQPVVKPRVAPRAARIAQLMALCPSDKERPWSILDIFDRGATQFRRDASPLNLHFSSRGAAKCVSRAEEKGVSSRTCQIASFTPRVTKHGLSGSTPIRHFFWSKPVLRPWFSRITRHETRITAFFVCFDRRVVRNAG